MCNNPYERYKKSRNTAWNVLIDNDICEMPVSLSKIARNNGIKIIKDSEAKMLKEGESGMSIFENGKWYIVYNDGESAGRRRFTIAHELGHIFLRHELKGVHRRTFAKVRPQEERDADSFAVRLLAPACVLWGLNIHTAEEIQKICGISRTAAECRAKRMEILYERNKFLTSSLERDVYENFHRRNL